MEFQDWFSSLPPALRPAYSLEEPNQTILLYKGELEVEQQNIVTKGSGTVYLKWFPYPQVEFHMSSYNLGRIDTGEADLKLSETEGWLKVGISRINEKLNQTEHLMQVWGLTKEPIIIGSGNGLVYIKFHLTNFYKLIGSCKSVFIQEDSSKTTIERVVFEAGGWRVTIDQLETVSQILNSLTAQGGYAITHVGKLERTNETPFAVDEARDFLEAFSYFLSFIRGFQVSPTLLVGYNASEQRVWEEWKLSNSDPWWSVESWAWGLDGKNLANTFPGFLKWWQDWGESAKLAIYWYLKSNRNVSGIEGSIILAQAALELIAWVCLVEKGSISEEDFNKKPLNTTSKKINRLLEECGIPQDIPSELINLADFECKLKNSNNGPYAFVEIRNSITHSAPNNRKTFVNTSSAARVEAWMLGLWYLELILLKIFNYKGSYFKRRPGHCWYGDVEPVPWV
jgi:hypothetical protein